MGPSRRRSGADAAPAQTPDAAPTRRYSCPDCGSLIDVAAGLRDLRCPYCASQLFFEAGLRRGGALVSVPCPDCGARTEVPEDSSSLVCAYCRGVHLIAGTGRVLRFQVPPKMSRDEAAGAAGALGLGAAAPGGSLVFVPYWRCRGMVYWFELGREGPDPEPRAGSSKDGLLWSLPLLVSQAETVRRLRTRALDQSLRAGAFAGGLDRFGQRLTQVNQEAFDLKTLSAAGQVLDPFLPEAEAMAAMTEGIYEDLSDVSLFSRMEHGNLVGGRVSLVWYPYWVFDCGGRKVSVEASGFGAAAPLGQAAARAAVPIPVGAPVLVSARCPDCGADLPPEGFHAVRFCVPCQAGWRLEEGRLAREAITVLDPGAGPGETLGHLPLWRLSIAIGSSEGRAADLSAFRRLVPRWGYGPASEDPKAPISLYVPGWGSRLTPALGALAKRYTREQPGLKPGGAFSRTARALFGPREAEELALIVLLSVIYVDEDLTRLLLSAKLEVLKRELLLVPCRRGAVGEWIDRVTGTAVHETEFLERYPV